MLAQTQQKAASSLTEVTWCGQALSIKSEKLRIILVRLKELIFEVKVRLVKYVHVKYYRFVFLDHFSFCEGGQNINYRIVQNSSAGKLW